MKRVLLLMLLLYSCSDSSGDKTGATLKPCKNEQKLVKGNATLPSVSFHLADNKDQVLEELNAAFPAENCGPYFLFRWENKTYQNLKLTYYDETRCMFMRDRFSARIDINRQGQILLDNDVLADSIEQISSTIAKKLVDNYVHNDYPGDIVLIWQMGTQTALLDSAIDQTLKGYLMAAKIASASIMKKELCDLNATELKKLEEAIPFILILDHTRKEIAVSPLPSS